METNNRLFIDKSLVALLKKNIFNNVYGKNVIIYIVDKFLFINIFYSLIKLKNDALKSAENNSNIKPFKIIISNSLNYKSIINTNINNYGNNTDSIYIDDDYLLKKLDINSFIDSKNHQYNLKDLFFEVGEIDFFLHTSGSTKNPILIRKIVKDMLLESEYLSKFIKNILSNKDEITNNLNNDLFNNKIDFINKLYYEEQSTDIKEKISICSIVPHNHMYGLTHNIFLSIMLDSTIVERKPVYENLSLFKEDILITSPEFLKNLVLMNKDLIPKEFKNIKIIISAGSDLSKQVRVEISKITNAIVINTYGSTETGIIAGDIGFGLNTYGSVNIINKNNENYVNSLWVNNFRLQDILEVHNNELKIIGREDRIIKIADKRFSLDRIEQVISENNLIKDCFAYNKNNRIGILIELSDDGIELYRKYGKKGIVSNIFNDSNNEYGKNIRYIKIVSKIYRNNNGKIDLNKNNEQINKLEQFEYNLIEENENELIFEAKVSVGEFYFKDHFYDFPLVPGFIELDTIIKTLNKLGYDYKKIVKISNLKFTSFIRPNVNITLKIIKKDNLVKFELISNNEKSASGNIYYE